MTAHPGNRRGNDIGRHLPHNPAITEVDTAWPKVMRQAQAARLHGKRNPSGWYDSRGKG
jgi:hypothetical protein